jgi:methionine synthase I (cobalamin-dependent)
MVPALEDLIVLDRSNADNRASLAALLEERPALLADGAIGTGLFAIGLTAGEAPELWNASKPEQIRALHQGFVDAGSDIILTNTFGGTRYRLKLHEAQERVSELNRLGAEIAREVAETAGRPVVVAGSVGPTGELLHPLGALGYPEAVTAFREQIEGLKAGGVDLIWIETMSSAEEMRAACQAAAAARLPYVLTASFDTAGKTMMGLAPSQLADVAAGLEAKPLAIGANCGVGASDLLSAILDITAAEPGAIVVAKANCGIPVVSGDKVRYSGTPELMARYARLAIDAGARIVGGCCGTGCEHLAAMRRALDEYAPTGRPEVAEIVEQLGPLVNKTAAANDLRPRRETRRRRG